MSASGNDRLRDEIVRHCFGRIGLGQEVPIEPIFNLPSPEYLIDKRIAFSEEDRQYQNKVFGAEVLVDKNKFQILLGDTGNEISTEWTLIAKMANASFAFQISRDEEDFLCAYFEQNNAWHPAGIPLLAKILNGFENLHMRSFALRWEKIASYVDIYETLIAFLKSQ